MISEILMVLGRKSLRQKHVLSGTGYGFHKPPWVKSFLKIIFYAFPALLGDNWYAISIGFYHYNDLKCFRNTTEKDSKELIQKKEEKETERLIRVEERHVKYPLAWAHVALHLRWPLSKMKLLGNGKSARTKGRPSSEWRVHFPKTFPSNPFMQTAPEENHPA